LEQVHELTHIDPWFLVQIEDIIAEEKVLSGLTLSHLDRNYLYRLKRKGFSDMRIAKVLGVTEASVRELRHGMDIRPVYKRVDTCAAEFRSSTAYMYSCYDEECEAEATQREKIIVLGGGPNRIGQGIEFDYCCV